MSKALFGVRVSPQVKDRATVTGIMLDVIVALLPSLGMSVYLFGPRVLAVAAVSVATCVIAEKLCCIAARRPSRLRDMSACVTGLLLAMSLPVHVPYWAPVLGGVFAIVVVKQLYGGLGKNFMNPALAGRMLLLSFPGMMTVWVEAMDRLPVWGEVDVVSAATPMAYLHRGVLPPQSLPQMLLGQRGGAIGEAACFMLILGGLYLWGRRVISWRIPGTFLGTVALLTFLFPPSGVGGREWMLYNLLSGGLLLGALFMACDYATTPVTPRGQLLFGAGCGFLTVVLRCFGSYPEGVGFAILTMNCFVWLLDRVGRPRRFGVHPLDAAWEWSRRKLALLAKVRPTLPRRARSCGAPPAGEEQRQQRRLLQLKCAASLGGVMLVTALVVHGVYQATWELELERQAQEQRALLEQVMPRASIATQTPYMAEGALSITAGYSGSELIGHCIEVETQGFSGTITMVVGVDLNGQVTGVAVTGHSELAATGGKAMEQEYLSGYVGRSGTIREMDAISGATDSCRAVTAGVNKALYIVSRLSEGDIDYADSEV